MQAQIADLIARYSADPQMLLLIGIGLGALFFVYGVAGVFAGPTPQVRRLRPGKGGGGVDGADLIRGERDPSAGLLGAFVPSAKSEQLAVAKRLRQGGINAPNAVRNFYLVRTILGVVLPVLFLALVFAPEEIDSRLGFELPFRGLGATATLQVVTLLVVVGFYGPSVWLRSRIEERRRKIRQAMPNALDLLQISIEAGLGFDAAITRVARELGRASPPLAEEFLMLQLEIQAGKDRDRAFLDMAERTGVAEMASFANVILQATQFGMSVSEALAIYAHEMRLDRELKAQEKANKLPVQMSAVLAALMMPTLLMITLTPVLIRMIRMFAETPL